jgi:hypothetical protein
MKEDRWTKHIHVITEKSDGRRYGKKEFYKPLPVQEWNPMTGSSSTVEQQGSKQLHKAD